MGHIFISYSHQDKVYVHKLQETLQNEGFNVWIDDRIDYGEEWPKVIEKHLDECDAFILAMSNNSRESEMVQNEVTRAKNKRKTIFPLLLNGENWLIVEAKQYIDVMDGSLPTEKFYKRLEKFTPRKSERAERKTTEKTAREKPERQAAQIAVLKETLSKSFTAIKSVFPKVILFLIIMGFVAFAIALCLMGLWEVPHLLSIVSTAEITMSHTSIVAKTPFPMTFTETVTPSPTTQLSLTPSPTTQLSLTLTTGCTSAPGEIVKDYVWLRTGPGVNYRALALYDKGLTVTVLGKNQNGEWLVVSLADGRQGWVSSTSIYMNKLGCDLAIETEPPTQTPLPTLDSHNTSDPCVRAQRQYQKIMKAYGTSSGDPGYASGADLNGDGQVNIVDVGIMTDHWPAGCPSP